MLTAPEAQICKHATHRRRTLAAMSATYWHHVYYVQAQHATDPDLIWTLLELNACSEVLSCKTAAASMIYVHAAAPRLNSMTASMTRPGSGRPSPVRQELLACLGVERYLEQRGVPWTLRAASLQKSHCCPSFSCFLGGPLHADAPSHVLSRGNLSSASMQPLSSVLKVAMNVQGTCSSICRPETSQNIFAKASGPAEKPSCEEQNVYG